MSNLDGLDWLALSHSDRRRLRRAARYFVRTKTWDRAKDILRIAEQLGDVRCVLLLKEAGHRFDVHDLRTTNFATWFKYHGVRWFDIYHDSQAGVRFIHPNDWRLLKLTVNRLTESPDIFWSMVNESAQADNTYPAHRQALLKLLATGRQPVIPDDRTDDTEEKFNHYCHEQGITQLRKLQAGRRGAGMCSHVWLAQDSDGLIKVFKEIIRREQYPLNHLQLSEDRLFYKLRSLPNLPRCYGVTTLRDGPSFLRLSTEYGQTLEELLADGPLDPLEVRSIIQQLAELLAELHRQNLIYRDLRPQNVKVKDGRVILLDLGDAVEFPTPGHSPKEAMFMSMADPKFAPPEVTLGYQLWPKSDVFQLGVLTHLLATGSHPFWRPAVAIDQIGDEGDREIMEYALPMAREPYDDHELRTRDAGLADLVRRLLVTQPADRPTMSEIATELKMPNRVSIKHRPRRFESGPERNTILFPARLGIPHRGHIDYLARLLELGFHVVISLQNSYCITTFDPLPKWIVLKMVAQSLLNLGFGPDRFKFLLTPTYNTLEERRLHFALMPGREDVIAVASSNPKVWELFPELPILDQAAVFGHENQEHKTRSWGSILRRAVRDGDYQTFLSYAASGVETIMSFDELRQRYGETPTKFVAGHVTANLKNRDGMIIATSRVTRYETPEQALIRAIRSSGDKAELIDPYARESVVELNGVRRCWCYERTRLTDQDAQIDFVLD